jgi:hypothetical protein
MQLRRHLIPGIVLAIALLALVAFVAARQSTDVEVPAAPTSTTTPESASTPGEGAAPAAEPRTATVQAPAASPSGTTVALKAADVPASTATLVVDGTRYGLTAQAGATLKEAMDRLETEGGFSYDARNYAGLGAFVTHINGRASGSDQYWILYVNGAKSSTGISATRIRQGDIIEWKLEQSY